MMERSPMLAASAAWRRLIERLRAAPNPKSEV
jgi:hypothetical protein